MKIKVDFTTNSSSSSFVCWGINKDDLLERNSDADYLKAFNDKLNEYKEDLKNAKLGDYINKYYPGYIKDMESNETDEEKIDYAQEQGLIDEDEFPNPLECRGPDTDYKFVGLTPSILEKEFPDIKFGEVREFTAKKINELLGTKLTAEDISYFEEGWMDN